MENEYVQSVYELLKLLDIKHDTVDYNGYFGVKCPYCGHTDRSKFSTHVGIKMTNLDGGFPVFHCVKCDIGGIVDQRFLEDLDLYDADLKYLEGSLKTELRKRVGQKGFKSNRIKPIKILPPLNNKHTIAKIKYFEERLGIKLTTKDMIRNKIIFNLKDFLSYNNITNYTRHENVVSSLDKNYIGFLSTKNEFINFRKIDDNFTKYEKRYSIYNIFGLDDNTTKFFTLGSGRINVMKNIDVIMAEGTFDIFGVLYHIYDNKIPDDTIFMAVGGMGYASAIKYLNKLGILFANYQIYSDSSVELSTYRNMKHELGYRLKGNDITIHYNTLSKDCGVPKDQILIKSFKI